MVSHRLKRLNERDWDLLDRGLAAFLFLITAADVTLSHRHALLAPKLLAVAVMSTALLWRRKNALLSAIFVVAGGLVLLIGLSTPPQSSTSTFIVLVAAYSTGAHLDLRRSLAGVAVVTGAIAAVSIVKTPNGIFFPVVFFGLLPWAVGRVIRTQTALARELTEKAEREQIAREEEEARATAAERARVAREIHDVLAHNLSVMVIQAAGARRVIDRDPAAAAQAAGLISRTGREALSELRYVFGPVRKEDGDALGADPGLAHLDQLVSRAHRAGLRVDVRIEGERLELSRGADMAAYRVVQEALTNTLKHANGARATVTVRYEPHDVVIEVVDDGPASQINGYAWESGGHGLVGMRERVALYGGNLDVGRRHGGGFAVRARLPVEGVRA